jgi:hypothetical protein
VNEIDDKAFDEYLERTSGVSRRYRELPADGVPRALDERVLAEARAAVEKQAAMKSKARRLARWSVPLALAASVVLVVTVTRDAEMQKRAAPTYQEKPSAVPLEKLDKRSEPAAAPPVAPATTGAGAQAGLAAPKEQFVPEPKRETEPVLVSGNRIRGTPEDAALPVQVITLPEVIQTSPAVAAPPAPSQSVVEARVEALRKQAEESRQDAGAPATASTTTATAPPTSRDESRERQSAQVSEVVVTGQSRRNTAPPPSAGPRDTISRALSANAGLADGTPTWESDPPAWLEHIRELRKQNRVIDADHEWERFRKAYPEFEVAETDAARPTKP